MHGARRGIVRLSAAGGGMGAAGFFLFYLRFGRHVGFVDKCWHMSMRSLLVCATIWGFRPSPLFCLRVAERNGALPLFLIGGWGVDTRSGGAAVCRVRG